MATHPVVDDSGFPLLRVRLPGTGVPGRIEGFLAGISRALDREAPFVALFQDLPPDAEESLEERQAFAAWYKREKPRVARHLLGFVYAVPDDAQRAELEEEVGVFRKNPAFPMKFVVLDSLAAAEAEAARLLVPGP